MDGRNDLPTARMNKKHMQMPVKEIESDKYVIIASMPRSGSCFITGVLHRAGLRIGHEHPEDGGVAGWTALFPASDFYKKAMDFATDLKKELVWLHQIRHPLSTIESMAAMIARGDWNHWGMPELWRELRGVIDYHVMDSLLVCAMKLYIHLDSLVPKQTEFSYRIEDLADAWAEICDRADVGEVDLDEVLGDPQFESPFAWPTNSHRNRKGYMPLSWELFEGVNPVLTNQLKEICDIYGYDVD